MIKSNRVEYDDTPFEPQMVGLCWYTSENYAQCLDVFDDREEMHDNYTDWLAAALAAEEEMTKHGVRVIRVPIDPKAFVEWCRENGIESVDRKARTIYSGIVALDSIDDLDK